MALQEQEEVRALFAQRNEINKRLNELLKNTALGETEDYRLHGPNGDTTALSDLFGDKSDLIVIQNMGQSCRYCTMWADGFMGVKQHLEDRAAFALVSPDSPSEQQAFAKSRGWTFRILSSHGTPFKKDLGFESETGDQSPGVSTFRREGTKLINIANDFFGPGDSYCAVWHLYDLLHGGADGWEPQYEYVAAAPES
jgi:predicted dithiol-disulfide oxidoreductase (DUF899 family)|tara:strand:- start:45 stop:635 length:591 start_codon:yes stop_codon:yes gene_type:complete